MKLYDKIIKEQEEKGFIEKIGDDRVIPASHYLPHLPVVKDSRTTPLRTVFNCFARKDKASSSLNDGLYSGPSLTEKLGKILLKFRTNPFAYAADISKAFLRVGLQEDDRDFTRFLWPENPENPDSKLVTYKFKSVLFGAASSPFLLQATLSHHLNNWEDPGTCREIRIVLRKWFLKNFNEEDEAPDESSLAEESNGEQAGPSRAKAREGVTGTQPLAATIRLKGRLQEWVTSRSVG